MIAEYKLFISSPKNPTLEALVVERGNVLERRTGLWSTEAKM
jgi:hypothetical protein